MPCHPARNTLFLREHLARARAWEALKAKMRKAQKVQTKLDLAADDEVRAQSSSATTPRCLKFAMDREP